MGENHVIQIRCENTENKDNSSFNLGFSTFGFSTNITKFVKVASVAVIAVNTANALCKELPLAYLSRIGEYTGDTQKQNQIDDAFSNFRTLTSTITGFLTDPVGTIMNEYIRQRDYNLKFQKQNENFEYLRKELLVDFNKGGGTI